MGLNKKHVLLQALVVGLVLFVLSLSVASPSAKRLEVRSDQAEIHLKPDINSPVIEVLERGKIVTLASSRTFKRQWSYIYFTSNETGTSKSGYVQDSAVSKLFQVTKVNTISNPKVKRKVSRAVSSPMVEVSWGMKPDRILEVEGNPQLSGQRDGWRVLEYHRRVLGMLCHIHYFFSGNRL